MSEPVLSFCQGSWLGAGPQSAVVSVADPAWTVESVWLSETQLRALLDSDVPDVELDLNVEAALLAQALKDRRQLLVEATVHETGFTVSDSQDLIDAAITVAERLFHGEPQGPETSIVSVKEGRRLRLSSAPYGKVAVVLPQNAFPYMAVLCGLSALAAGNRVVLRAPSQCAASVRQLGRCFDACPGLRAHVSLVLADGRTFAGQALDSEPTRLLHVMGSSQTGASYLESGFLSGTSLIVDGDGNTLAYVGKSADVESSTQKLATGSTRFNGQTCTSVNGVVAHPDVVEELVTRLVGECRSLKAGGPFDSQTNVGPLFSGNGAARILDLVALSGAQVVAGGEAQGQLLLPTLAVDPSFESDWVRSGVFGPALWVSSGDESDFMKVWRRNRYPLCAAVFESDPDLDTWTRRLPGLARLVVNGDPSDEDPLEPWGGYASSANSPVSSWPERYSRTVQADVPD